MTTDTQVRSNVLEEIAWEPCVHIRNLSVSTGKDKGVVILNGDVDDFDQKWLAGQAAGRAFGLKSVRNNIQVCLASTSCRTDSQIAHSVGNALIWIKHIPSANVLVDVSNGHVHLTGLLQWEFQRQAVTRSVRTLPGIKNLNNEISISLALAPNCPYAISSLQSVAVMRLPPANVEVVARTMAGVSL